MSYWTVENQVGDLPSAIAYFHSKLPGWWFSVGACHVSADATVCPDTAGSDDDLLRTGDDDVTKFFDTGFDVDLLPPATMADALIRATDLAFAARSAYLDRNRLSDAIAALADMGVRA
ncbi:hypothetical protein ABIE93_005994 [Bradyrhizobium elkanii]|uniref:hypothetical protein n=1 Tax=Bradyrhizobium elkanii TaxID=29448 RepID=UPI003511CAC1